MRDVSCKDLFVDFIHIFKSHVFEIKSEMSFHLIRLTSKVSQLPCRKKILIRVYISLMANSLNLNSTYYFIRRNISMIASLYN